MKAPVEALKLLVKTVFIRIFQRIRLAIKFARFCSVFSYTEHGRAKVQIVQILLKILIENGIYISNLDITKQI